MGASTRVSTIVMPIVVALLAGSAAHAVDRSPTATSVPISTGAPSDPRATSTVPAPVVPPSPTTATAASDVTPIPAGSHTLNVLGTDSEPRISVVVPNDWYDAKGFFVIKYPATGMPAPVLGVSVWDVAKVFRDPCQWHDQEVDPGPGVDDLVAALVAQPMRNATKPIDVTLAGYPGRYLEWSVPVEMKSSAPAEFDDCYADPSDGQHNFMSFTGNGIGNRFQQVPGQVDRLWVLDVDGHRLLVDATYSPDTSPTDRQQLQQIVESLRFAAP
jgi:hypothetical protein